jgi:hypothetical protein
MELMEHSERSSTWVGMKLVSEARKRLADLEKMTMELAI